jgi:hypothetical protein
MNKARWLIICLCAITAIVFATVSDLFDIPETAAIPFYGEALCPEPSLATPSSYTDVLDGSVIVVPDPQYETKRSPEQLIAQMDYIITRHPDVVLFLGDMVDNAESRDQWAMMKIATDRLTSAGIRWIPALGNHDVLPDGSTLMSDYLHPGAWISGAFEGSRVENTWSLLRIGGVQWMIMSLEFSPRNEVVVWANSVLAQHTEPVILVTHAYLQPVGYIDHFKMPAIGQLHLGNDGRELLAKLVLPNSNIKLVLCGHLDGAFSHSVVRKDGTFAQELLQDYQSLYPNGQSWVRELHLDYQNRVIDVSTYSPLLRRYSVTAGDRFQIQLSI